MRRGDVFCRRRVFFAVGAFALTAAIAFLSHFSVCSGRLFEIMPDWRLRRVCDAIARVDTEDAREEWALNHPVPAPVPLPATRPAPLHLCPALIDGRHVEIPQEYAGSCYPDDQLYTVPNCSAFLSSRNLITSVSKEEESFPIAFTILAFRSLCQLDRLVAALFRPHNPICIHVDARAPNARRIHRSVQNMLKCYHMSGFNNVFLASRLVDVEWAAFSSLEADLLCMHDLLDRTATYPWKYLINLSGQEFPLKTNLEMVRLLSRLDGANVVEGYPMSDRMFRERFAAKAEHSGPPFPANSGVRVMKGEPRVILCRGFVEEMFTDPSARALLAWLNDSAVSAADEEFFNTLNHNAAVLPLAGAFTRSGSALPPFGLVRHIVWTDAARCASGRFTRGICIFGVRDLPTLTSVSLMSLFVNKLYWNVEPLAFDCLEHWLRQKAARERTDGPPLAFSRLLTELDGFRMNESHVPCAPFQQRNSRL